MLSYKRLRHDSRNVPDSRCRLQHGSRRTLGFRQPFQLDSRYGRGLHRACSPGLAILALCGLLCATDARAITGESHERHPLVLSGGVQSMTVPWHTGPMTKRYNPVFIIGAEHTLRSWGSWRLYQTANLGYFQHYWWISGVFLDSELGIGRGLLFGFGADLRLGVGYLHYFWRRKVLELEEGEYVEKTNWGKPSVMVPLSAALGYRDIQAGPLTVAPFVSAQWAVQMLLIDESDVMTHVFLLIGARVNWE